MAILLSVAAAVAWGAADFFGGTSRRGTSVFVIVAVSEFLGLVVLVPILAARGIALPHNPRLLLAGVAGVGVTLELGIIYAALSRGEAFITAPVGALGAAIAVTAGLISGDTINLLIAAGLICALVGGAVSAWRPRASSGRRSVLRSAAMCVGAAAGVATMLTAFHAAGRIDPYWATATEHASTALSAGLIALVTSSGTLGAGTPGAGTPGGGTPGGGTPGGGTRGGGTHRGGGLRSRLPQSGQVPALALVAVTGVGGDLAYAAASGHGALSVVSALSSLYPITTITLGMLIQRHRPSRVHTIGIVLALVGAVALGAATR
jgi:drug/metabolite transporter (DMT)-like permease